MWTFFKNLLFAILILAILGVLGILGLFIYFGKDLPSYSHLASYEPPVLTRMYSHDGRLFAEYATEKRVFVPIRAIPQNVIRTFLAVEDKNFYDHIGLDWVGLTRATINNLITYFTGKGSLMGGSTITQQVAKNFLLSSEQTMTRKIKEAILSLRLEKTYDKNKILELYLNEIYLGCGAYGVAAAALHYFNKSLKDLSIAEVAFLAALPKSPSHYHPIHRKDAAIARRNWVITRMMEEGLITSAQALEAKKDPLHLNSRIMTKSVHASYFAEDVRRFVHDKMGSKALYEGGLSVHTTLDARLQKIADDVLRESLISFDHKLGWHGTLQTIPLKDWKTQIQSLSPPVGVQPWVLGVVLDLTPTAVKIGLKDGSTGTISFESMMWARAFKRNQKGEPYLGPVLKSPQDILHLGNIILVEKVEGKASTYTLQQVPDVDGALVALNPHTGQVLAMAGGFSFDRSEFNGVSQAMRQTGSAFKAFTYLAALEKGYSPVSLLKDAPFVIKLPNNKFWAPRNIERRFFGINTLRHAVEKSFNATIVRLAHTMGMKPIRDVAKRFGIYDNLPPHLSAVLGSEATTLLRFAAAFGMLVNGGKKITPHLVDRIKDRHGETIYKHDQRTCACLHDPWNNQDPPELEDLRENVTDPLSAYQMVSILEGATLRGTGRRAKPRDHIVGVKTGTTNDNKDVWTLGFSRDLVVGVRLGYTIPASMGKTTTGGTTAAPVFRAFMERALEGETSLPFRVPEGAKFITVNSQGRRTSPSAADAILEVFKPNQEPNGTAPLPEPPTDELSADPTADLPDLKGIY